MLRKEDGKNVTLKSIKSLLDYCNDGGNQDEILYYPSRVLMQDFTGVPAVVDLAAMRDAMKNKGLDPKKINPKIPVDLVIDHSVQVDKFGSSRSYAENIKLEFQRNDERYQFLKWGQESFENFRVIPPGKGICHQVNLEYLASVVSEVKTDGHDVAFFDTVVGTDSHTTMINGLAVLGWGVGGIEAEATMLGQPTSLLVPKVVGFKLTGKLSPGITATDLVLTITEILRKKNVVGKFVEFYGPALEHLSLFERATIANMAPEYGATCGYFPIDAEVIKYLDLTGRSKSQLALVEAYAKEQCVWWEHTDDDKMKFNEHVELDISHIQPCIAGPKRPQDKILLSELKSKGDSRPDDGKLKDGDIVISAITSCTNTSNPYVLMGAGLLAKRAYDLGLKTKKWVKTSLAPGSQVVTEYLEKSGLIYYLEKLGFYLGNDNVDSEDIKLIDELYRLLDDFGFDLNLFFRFLSDINICDVDNSDIEIYANKMQNYSLNFDLKLQKIEPSINENVLNQLEVMKNINPGILYNYGVDSEFVENEKSKFCQLNYFKEKFESS